MSVVSFKGARPARRESGTVRAGRNIYALQRRIGFVWLRFLRPLEREYQAAQLPMLVVRTQRLWGLAVLGLIGALILNRFTGHTLISARGETIAWITMGIMVFPFSLFALPRFRPMFRAAVFIVFYIYGFGVATLILVSRLDHATISNDALLLVTLAGYFVSSMPMIDALVFGFALTGSYVLGGWWLGLPKTDLLPDTYFLVAANLLGLLGHYYFDYTTRLNFLLRSELEELAYCDGLTGLLNRRAFYRHLRSVWKQAEREGCRLGLAVVDMDELKRVNDTLGHSEGDRCLRIIGEVLGGLAQRPLDGVGRLGGDEFAGVWFDVEESWPARFDEILRERIRVDSQAQGLRISVSVGVSIAMPRKGVNPFRSLNEADDAMYRVKRGRYSARG